MNHRHNRVNVDPSPYLTTTGEGYRLKGKAMHISSSTNLAAGTRALVLFRVALLAIATLALFAVSSQADGHIPVKVVIVTTFQSGNDNDPKAGEFGNWVLYLPLPKTIPFPQGYHHLRYNRELQVLGIVTGEGKSHAAASIMGLGMDPRFDLSKAYWLVAAIAGVDPNKGSVASTAWAKFVVDGDLSYQIDARQIPPGWPTGYVPLGRSSPYEAPSQPFNSNGVQQVYQLNVSLADWAFRLPKAPNCRITQLSSKSAPVTRIIPMRSNLLLCCKATTSPRILSG
jgi:purine nucleoside permease